MKNKTIIISVLLGVAALASSLVLIPNKSYAQFSSTVENFFKRSGNAIFFANSNHTLGDSSNRLDIFADDLDVTTLITGGTVTGDISLSGDLSVTGTSTLATTTIDVMNKTIYVGSGLNYPNTGAGLQAALDDCQNLRDACRRVYLVDSVETTATTTIPFDPEFILEGAKRGSSKVSTSTAVQIKATASMHDLISMEGNYASANSDLTHGLVIKNLWLNGNSNVTNVLRLKNQDGVTIEDVLISGGTNGLVTEYEGVDPPTAASIPGAIKVFRSSINSTAGTSISLNNQTESWFTDVWFAGTPSTTILINESNQLSFSGLRIGTTDVAVHLMDDGTTSAHDIRIVGSTFTPGASAKIFVDDRTAAGSSRIALAGNTYTNGNFSALTNGEEVIPQQLTIKATSTNEISLAVEDYSDNVLFSVDESGNVTSTGNVVLSGGYLGIGTTTPIYPLSIETSDTNLSRLVMNDVSGNTQDVYITLTEDSGDTWNFGIDDSSGGALHFTTNDNYLLGGNIIMVLEQSGDVGVGGTQSPDYTFSVEDSSGNGLFWVDDVGSVGNATTTGAFVVGSPTPHAAMTTAGTITAEAVYDDTTLLTDYIFDLYFDGELRVEDKPLYSDKTILSISETQEYAKQERHLPTIDGRDEWEKEGGFSLGKLVTQIWETVEVQAIHIWELFDWNKAQDAQIKDLEQRIEQLEAALTMCKL